MTVTSTAANRTPITRKRPERYQPGARSLAAISLPFSSLGHTRKVLHERVELAGLQRLPEVRRHHVGRVALGDLRVRLDDRRADEGLGLALQRLVEVRAHRAGRARVRQRVAGRAAGGIEHGLALRRGGAARGLLTTLLPLSAPGRGAAGAIAQPAGEGARG